MGSPIANGLANTFRYFPQHVIEGLLGPKWGPKVEGFVGMSPAPADAMPGQDTYQPAGSPGLPPQWEEANRISQQQHKQDLSTMRKPLPKGK